MLYYAIGSLYVLTCLVLLLVILLQQGKGGDIASAFGGSSSQTAFGARAGATLLTRVTTVCAALFMVGALALAIIGQKGPGSVLRGAQAPAAPATKPAATTPGGQTRGAGHDDTGSARLPLRRRHRRRRRSRSAFDLRARDRHSPGRVATHPHRGSGGIGRRTSLRGWR